jgi:hypothetical protein
LALAFIGNDLSDLTKKLGLSSDLLVLERAWEEEVGGMREFAHIAALDNGALVVDADSHVVMQEISLRRRELVRKLNKHFPAPTVTHIHVRIAQQYGR